jgi:hypothetical protein
MSVVCGKLWVSTKSKGRKMEHFQTKAIELKWRIRTLTENIEFTARQGWSTHSLFVELTKVQAELVALLGGDEPDEK